MTRNDYPIELRNIYCKSNVSFRDLLIQFIGLTCSLVFILWVTDELNFRRLHNHSRSGYIKHEQPHNRNGFSLLPGSCKIFLHYCKVKKMNKLTIITIKHLLTMQSGLSWDQDTYPLWDNRNDTRKLFLEKDIAAFILGKSLSSSLGKEYKYSNGSSALLGIICSKASNMKTTDFAN